MHLAVSGFKYERKATLSTTSGRRIKAVGKGNRTQNGGKCTSPLPQELKSKLSEFKNKY
jgi:hypothetical protein